MSTTDLLRLFAFPIALVAAGCPAGDDLTDLAPPDGAASDAGSVDAGSVDAGSVDAGSLAPRGVPFARTDDRRLALHAFGYFGGSFEWEGAREALSPSRQQALAGLRLVAPAGRCPTDITEYELEITRANGEVAKARGSVAEAPCGADAPVLETAGVRAFVAALGCVSTAERAGDLARAPTIRPNDGCRHGFFAYRDFGPGWLKVEIPAPGTYEARISQCTGVATAIELFDAAGATPLAAGEGSGEQDARCARIAHTFAAAGTYAVKLTARPVTRGGHVLLELRGAE